MSIARKLDLYPTRCLCVVMITLALLSACRSSSSDSSKYKYLQQGQTQIRVDERSGRTDRLTNSGWVPISFESPSVEVPKDQLKHVTATIVGNGNPPLCYTIDNDSTYVLKEVWVSLPVRQTNKSETKKADENPLLIFLNSPTGGFAPVGNRFEMCDDSSHNRQHSFATPVRRGIVHILPFVRLVASGRTCGILCFRQLCFPSFAGERSSPDGAVRTRGLNRPPRFPCYEHYSGAMFDPC